MSLPISLIGLPGGGKSTVGRQLARRLGWKFIDSDSLIEASVGTSIRKFFDAIGEEEFRAIEAQTIRECVDQSRVVLATGGGTVLNETSRGLLHSKTHAIYLKSTPEDLYRRLRYDSKRPLLQVADPLAKLRELYRERDPLYREVAHFVVETGRPSVASLVNMVVMQLELAGIASTENEFQIKDA